MSSVDIIIVMIYFFLTIIIGIDAGQNMRNLKDFIVGNKNFPTITLVMTICATGLASEDVFSPATEVHRSGLIAGIVYLGGVVNCLLSAWIVAPRIDAFSDKLTVGEIVGDLYGNKARIISGLASTFLAIGYMGAQIKAISFIFHHFFDISPYIGTWISCAIVIAYSAFGGIRSVTITDVFQFTILIVIIPQIFFTSLGKIGGFSELLNAIPAKKASLDFSVPNLNEYITYFAILSIPLLSPAMVQRMLMARNSRQIRDSFIISGFVKLIFYTFIVLLGFVGCVLYPTNSSNELILSIIDNELPIGFKGLAVSSILAIIMSTIDSMMNVGSVSFAHDVVKPVFPNLTEKQELQITKGITVFMGVGSVLLALNFDTILSLLLYAFNLWAPLITVPLYCGLFGVRAAPVSFHAGVIGGAITVYSWKLFQIEKIIGVDSLVPAMLINLLFFTMATPIVRFYKNVSKV